MLPEGWQMMAFVVVYVGLGVFGVLWAIRGFARGMSGSARRQDLLQRLRRDLLGPGGIFLLLALLGILSNVFSG